jgi:hypothetical protein
MTIVHFQFSITYRYRANDVRRVTNPDHWLTFDKHRSR